jgi:acyl-CoA dehydrogenase
MREFLHRHWPKEMVRFWEFSLSVVLITEPPNRITNGIWCDYATMAVRTGGPDSKANGLSLLLVPLTNTEGVSMRRFKVAGHVSAGTTFIDLDEVKVPVSNLIGEENQGMKYIMTNFNHERLSICIGGTRQARAAREAFGKTLVDQPVVRHRLAICGGMVEAQWSWVEQITYMMSKMKKVDVSCLLPPV